MPGLAASPKPQIRPWKAPGETQEKVDYADLFTIDLSLFDSSNPEDQAKLLDDFKTAIFRDGFLYLVNFGLSQDQIDEQFAIAQHALIDGNISPEEMQRYVWKYYESGKYSGYKPRGFWDTHDAKDNIESYNYYSPELTEDTSLPAALQPFLPEMIASHLHNIVNRKLLTLLSRLLELPDDHLWETVQSKNGVIGEGYFRQMHFFPRTVEETKAAKGVQMHGHQDYGVTTMLLSQPIAALQVLSPDNQWRYVKYKRGGMVVNLGEVLEMISGGHLPATKHRVTSCPVDQAQEHRLTIGLFTAAKNDFPLAPMLESPKLQREGWKTIFEVGVGEKEVNPSKFPKAEQWRIARVLKSQTNPVDVVVKNGVRYNRQVFQGVSVMEPI